MNNCHLEHFAPIFVRGQNGSEGVVEKVDTTWDQNMLIIMSDFHKFQLVEQSFAQMAFEINLKYCIYLLFPP